MVKYIVKRILQAIPVLIALSMVVFLIMRVFSADPAPVVLGEHATREAMDAWRDSNGLNDPIWKQYLDFVAGALHGDLGTSYYTHTAVTTEIMSRFPATIELAIVAIIIASVVGIALGVVSSVNKGKFVDALSTFLALIGVSMPIFWLGILFIIFFTGILHILPSGGRIDPIMQPVGGTGLFLIDTLFSGDFEAFGNALVHMIMPACALSMYSMAIITRMTRSSMLDTLNEDYVRTARGFGIPYGTVVARNVLRNALITPVTVLGLKFGYMIGGAVVLEVIFALPGMGMAIVSGVTSNYVMLVQGVVLVVAITFIIVNVIVDMLYILIDPRIRTV